MITLAKIAMAGLCLTILTWTQVWVIGAAEASDQSKAESEGCVAFYVIPANYKDRFDVDACWGGPHITLVGFDRYPHKASSGKISYHQALHDLPQEAAKACTGAGWRVSDHNAKLFKPHRDSRTAAYRYLEFGTAEKPSHSLNALKTKLFKLGAHEKHSHKGSLHLTFDQCGCYSKCPNDTRNKWEKDHTGWTLIPVSSTECDLSGPADSCSSIPNPHQPGKNTHGRCAQPNQVTWHPHLGATVKSCSK